MLHGMFQRGKSVEWGGDTQLESLTREQKEMHEATLARSVQVRFGDIVSVMRCVCVEYLERKKRRNLMQRHKCRHTVVIYRWAIIVNSE